MIVKVGDTVWGRGRKESGIATGTVRRCQMDGCTGVRIGVRWSDGKITWPCSKGMEQVGGAWEVM